MVESGHAVHRTLRGPAPARPGDVIVLAPGEWHAWESCRSLRLWNCCFGNGLLTRELAWARNDPWLGRVLRVRDNGRPASGHLDAAGVATVSEALALAVAAGQQADPARVRPLLLARILIALEAVAGALPADTTTSGDDDARITELMSEMTARLDHPWGLVELAVRTGWDRSHLVRRFRRAAGVPPLAWLAQRRAERAAVLLLTTRHPVAEIGAAVGWSDANFFSRRFRALFGQTPSDYRRQLPCPPLPPRVGEWVWGVEGRRALSSSLTALAST